MQFFISDKKRHNVMGFSQTYAPESVSHGDGDSYYEAQNDISIRVACDECVAHILFECNHWQTLVDV